MKKVTVIIEVANDGGFSCYMADDIEGLGLMGYGDTAEEAKNDLLVAYEEIKELNKEEGKETPVLEFSFKYDIASFFDYYKMLNVTEVARRVGINPSLMRRYRSGISHASQKQYDKLRDYIHRLGAELSAAQF
ncbi:MAG: pilus assembly protein HicB [Bacteroidaceae bacterium]|nr:pilus assembly protein HicB [Bacteroidaceae bacterium]MBQ8543485.1 pilus assembly protein HicB [Bacteroidaceae bacterium]